VNNFDLKKFLVENRLTTNSYTIYENNFKQIAANLYKAFKAGPKATREYLNSEEGKSQEARDILKKPEPEHDGGQENDDTVNVTNIEGALALKFLPTQNFIDLMQSVSYPLGSSTKLIEAITNPVAEGVVTSKNLIIDGHHRWSGAISIGGEKAKIGGKNVDWPGKDTKEILASAQLAIAAYLGPGKEQPSKGGDADNNILGKNQESIYELILNNVGKQSDKGAPGPLLNEEMCSEILNDSKKLNLIKKWANSSNIQNTGNKDKLNEEIADVDSLRKIIAKKVSFNLTKVPSNEAAPNREDMPQFDPKVNGPKLTDIEPFLQGGKYNISPPFVKK
jgi:hypothetical protein